MVQTSFSVVHYIGELCNKVSSEHEHTIIYIYIYIYIYTRIIYKFKKGVGIDHC